MMTLARTTIFVVDDDDIVRDSLRALLESAGYLVSDFGSADTFLSEVTRDAVGCLVTDIRMPGMDGLELQRELVKLQIRLPVIIITGHGDIPLAVMAMKCGALDFIEKPFDDEALLNSVQRGVETAEKAQEHASLVGAAAENIASLTARERQVLDLLIAGHANKVIAYKLDISPRTVEVHRGRVMEKMGARNLSDLVRAGLAAGIDIGL
jgi:two-component system, LuxR family, response regulator FixJ